VKRLKTHNAGKTKYMKPFIRWGKIYAESLPKLQIYLRLAIF